MKIAILSWDVDKTFCQQYTAWKSLSRYDHELDLDNEFLNFKVCSLHVLDHKSFEEILERCVIMQIMKSANKNFNNTVIIVLFCFYILIMMTSNYIQMYFFWLIHNFLFITVFNDNKKIFFCIWYTFIKIQLVFS